MAAYHNIKALLRGSKTEPPAHKFNKHAERRHKSSKLFRETKGLRKTADRNIRRYTKVQINKP